MKLENINKLLIEATKKSYQRLLFSFNMGEIVFKCLLLVDNRILMISIKNLSFGHSISFDKYGKFPGKVPIEFYNHIVSELENIYYSNEVNLMWENIDRHLLTLNIEKISEVSNNDIIDIIETMKTKDKKFDPDGEKPFFDTWVRNTVKTSSNMNYEKTKRYFGYYIANLCKKQNISSRWSKTPRIKSLDLLDIKKTENELLNLK